MYMDRPFHMTLHLPPIDLKGALDFLYSFFFFFFFLIESSSTPQFHLNLSIYVLSSKGNNQHYSYQQDATPQETSISKSQ